MKKMSLFAAVVFVSFSAANAGWVDMKTYVNGTLYQPHIEAAPRDTVYLEVYLPNVISSHPQVAFTQVLNVSWANFPVEEAVFPGGIGLSPWSGYVVEDGQGGINIVMKGGPFLLGNPHPGPIARITFTIPDEVPPNGKIIVDARAGTGSWFAKWPPIDGYGDSLPFQEILVVGTEPPIADAGEDHIADANELVILDASASYDPDGQIVLYTWTALPDGIVLYSGPDPVFATMALGRVEEVIKLTVEDDRNGTDEDTVSIFSRALAEIVLTPGPEGPQGPQGPPGPQGSIGPQGEQGPPGMTPEEVAEMQQQIADLQQAVAGLKSQIDQLKGLIDALQQANAELEQTVLDNRWLLEQLPQLRKNLDNLKSEADE